MKAGFSFPTGRVQSLFRDPVRNSCRSLITACAAHETPRFAPDVVCLSGGVESSTLLATLTASRSQESTPRPLLPIFSNYAQRAAAHELAACQMQVSRARRTREGLVHPLVTLDLSAVGETVRGLTPKRRAHIPLRHRNLPLLSLAVSAASCMRLEAGYEAGDVSSVFIAVSADDLSWYPSATEAFLEAFRDIIGVLEPGLALETPFIGKTKNEIIALGEEAGVAWATTYSCMIGSDLQKNVPQRDMGVGELSRDVETASIHCGRCSQCVARKTAFREAGVQDGTHGLYRR